MSTLANGEHILNEFKLWRKRHRWTVEQGGVLDTVEDALDDIISGRWKSTQLSAKQVIAMKERGEL